MGSICSLSRRVKKCFLKLFIARHLTRSDVSILILCDRDDAACENTTHDLITRAGKKLAVAGEESAVPIS
jgi:hypothetical protein